MFLFLNCVTYPYPRQRLSFTIYSFEAQQKYTSMTHTCLLVTKQNIISPCLCFNNRL